jgi:energy-coupling factor transporter ATP-binding protein EcfA2
MPILQKCIELPRGARFYRADLHIHSFGASHDVTDTGMTPTNIVTTAIKENLNVISIADHNEISNVDAAIQTAIGTPLLVIPGVELSTPQGHLLCYLPALTDLQKFYGRLTIVDRGTQTSRCQNAILECLNLVDECGGFGVLAHVDAGCGFEQVVSGSSPHKIDVLCHKGLLGIELKSAISQICYADGDPDPSLATIGRERINRQGLGSKQFLARVLNSDAHTLEALGKNAEGNRKVTRIKMDIPSFVGLRIAFEDSDARIRIEDMIPNTVPAFLGVHLEGGFLNDQSIHFSPNLNCIIGGRGAGKSTTFEVLRLLSGVSSCNSVVDSEVWPNKLHLFWQDQAGQIHKLVRSIGGDIENLDNPDSGPVVFKLDCFGQGETAKISEKAKTDPLALLKYLDTFVDLESASRAEAEARKILLELQTEIEEASLKVESIPQYERALATTQKQLEALEKVKAKELIELQRKLATEQEARKQIVEKFENLKTQLSRSNAKTAIEGITLIADPLSFAVGVAEYQEIVKGANEFKQCVEKAEGQINEKFKEFTLVTSGSLKTWKSKETEAQRQIDLKRQEMEAQGIRLDMAYVQKLAKDEASQKQEVANLKAWIPQLKELRRKRAETLKERWVARDRVATTRETYGRIASQTLKEALSDLQVSLKYLRNGYSPDAAELIIQTMGWRTIQQQRAAILVEQLTIPKLLEAIERKDTTAITNLKTPEAVVIFNKSDATNIIDRLAQPAIKFALERCELYDLPRLSVTKMIPGEGGKTTPIIRDFSKLSLGQQQSVLLALILSSNSNHPLIIDQPEDNLDSEFIYHTLVPVLRRAKERRQVIIITHNANVAVLGDAEQILILKSNSEKARIVTRGSIDNQDTCGNACSILEGAKEAFARRAKIYGI